MLNITYIYMDKQKDDYFRRALDEYAKRISKYAKFTEKIVKPVSLPENPSKAQIDAALEKEGQMLCDATPKGAYRIALCVEGQKVSSEKFAQLFEKVSNMGKSEICFFVGSSYGLSENFKKACDARISFSDMTFPHGLFGVMLAEQIYRAFTINAGEKYHK